MELVSLTLLWVMMPLDATPHYPPARVEDLSLFPAEHVILAERRTAWHRKLYAEDRRNRSCTYCLPDAAYWCGVARQAHYVWDQWDDLKRAHQEGGNEEQAVFWLARFRKFAGPFSYFHGLLPPHVDLSEPVETVPLP